MTTNGKYAARTAKGGLAYNPKAKFVKSPGGTERTLVNSKARVPTAIRPKMMRKVRSNVGAKRSPRANVYGLRTLFKTPKRRGRPPKAGGPKKYMRKEGLRGQYEALRAAKAFVGHLVKVEIEVDTLDQLQEVLDEGADFCLLDNMSTDMMCEAVKMSAGRVKLEASGGITLKRVRDVAATGVDAISVGGLTHSAPAVDLSLEWTAV